MALSTFLFRLQLSFLWPGSRQWVHSFKSLRVSSSLLTALCRSNVHSWFSTTSVLPYTEPTCSSSNWTFLKLRRVTRRKSFQNFELSPVASTRSNRRLAVLLVLPSRNQKKSSGLVSVKETTTFPGNLSWSWEFTTAVTIRTGKALVAKYSKAFFASTKYSKKLERTLLLAASSVWSFCASSRVLANSSTCESAYAIALLSALCTSGLSVFTNSARKPFTTASRLLSESFSFVGKLSKTTLTSL